MASLVSPGVSVTVTDESFYIPAAAATVPLLFVATASEKLQPSGLDALGTFEHDVIRTVTSLKQSVTLYGVPYFREDFNGNAFHGDARNEYGLFALNQFLGLGNKAYVIRANVNLNDDRDSILALWDEKINQNTAPVGAAYVLEGLVSEFLTEWNATNGYIPSDANYRTTVTMSEFLSLAEQAMIVVLGDSISGVTPIWEEATFAATRQDFMGDHTSTPLNVFANGYDQAPTGTFLGLEGIANDWVTNASGSTVGFETEWTAVEARTTLIDAVDDFQYTPEFLNETSLGANDAARRVAITTALAASINSNTEIRSDLYEYNLVLAPGYHEVIDELLALTASINDEAMVIADTPMDMSPEDVVTWAGTTARQTSTDVAYYYAHGLASNLDGKEVLGAASGIALRTITYSDEVSELWFAPAGTRRGLVTGVTDMGYVTGTLGTATTFVAANLNQGQRDDLYKYFTNINPITYFPGRGIVVWGQKTSAADASALDRVNVSRLIKYIKRQLRKNTQSFVFEPNDQLTRDNLKAVIDNFLSDILVKRGLYDYVTVCDESNNTPDRIDRNEMYADVALKPVKAAEFIYIPIRIVATGAEI